MELEKRLAIGDEGEKRSFYAFPLMMCFFVALVLFGSALDGKTWSQSLTIVVVFLPFIGLPVYLQLSQMRRHLQFAKTEIVWNDLGIRLEEAGQTTWQIEWGRYGGFRRVAPKKWEWVPDPSSNGLEIIDIDGSVAGILPGFIHGQTAKSRLRSELWRNLVRELHRRSQSPQPEPKPIARPSLARRLLLATIGLGLVVPSLWATTQVLDIWRGTASELPILNWFAEGYRIAYVLLPLTIGAFLLLVPICSLLLQPAIEREQTREIESLTLPAPNLDDVRIKHLVSGERIALEPGKRYRYVEPGQIYRELRTNSKALWTTVALFGVMGVAVIISKWFDSEVPWSGAIFTASLALAMGTGAALGARYHARLLPNVKDKILIGDESVNVVDQSGLETVYSAKGLKPIRIPSRGSFRILQIGERNKKYAIDPSRLVEVEELMP